MPSVTVNIAGASTDKENLEAVTVGTQRWGQNGISYGQHQNVPAGSQTVTAFYSGNQSGSGAVQLAQNQNVIITVTANGPSATGVAVQNA